MKHWLPALCFFFLLTGHREVMAQFRIEGPETICAGTSATLSTVGCAGTLQWSTGATTVSITVTPAASTLYSVTCTESGGSPGKVNHTVGVCPKPPLTASTTNLCANENVGLSTNSTEFTHNDILWKRDGLPIVSGGGAYIANQAGTYTVEYGDSPGVWVPYPSAPAGGVYRTFAFSDDNNGWAIAGRQDLGKTRDGGKNWVKPAYTLNLGPADSLVDVAFTDAATGWTCAGGKIFKTSDGGISWIRQYADSSVFLNDLFFLDSQRGWAVGRDDLYRSLILRTNDGGATWQRTDVGFVDLNKIQFVSATAGWAGGDSVGGGLYRTTDGGLTWQQRSANPYSFPVSGFYFQDANQGWVISDRNIYRTQDGGLTWTYPQLPLFEYIEAPVVIKITDGFGWLLDWDSAYYTTDNGLTWRKSFYGNDQEQLTAAFLPSGKILAASKMGGLIKFLPKTQNCLSAVTILPALPRPKLTPSTAAALCQGESMTLTASGCAGTLSWSTGGTAAITITPSTTTSYTAFCAGANGCRSTAYAGVAVLPKATLDTASTAPCFRPVISVSNVWAGVDTRWTKDGQLLDYRDTKPYLSNSAGTYTAGLDAAGAWQPQAATRSDTYQEPGYPIDYLKDVQFVNDSTGFIVGSENQFMRTTDGGKNWIASKLSTYGDRYGSYSLHFIDANQGWIAGSFNDMEQYGEVLRTMDGGVSWEKARLGLIGSGTLLKDIFFVKTPFGYPAGWGVGDSGRIVNSFDGGYSWTTQTSNITAHLKSVFFLDNYTGWVGGENGTLLTTTDGGANWTPHTIANVPSFQSIQFLDASHGWAVTANSDNGLYRTSDSGLNWTQVTVDANHETYLKKVQFLNENAGFVQSEKFIHVTTDGGLTWRKSYHHLNTGGMSFTDASHGWVVGGSIMTYVSAPPACPSAPVTVLPASLTPLRTLASGAWDTTALWSCGTVPTALDDVRIDTGHTITIPLGYSAKAKNVDLRGQIQYNTNASLRMGQE